MKYMLMAVSSAFQFGNTLSAGMSNMTEKDYVASHATMLERLHEIEAFVLNLKIKSKSDYEKAHDMKSLLCSLSCYTFNNSLPENKQVWKIEAELGHKMFKWTMKNLAPSAENLMIRYILWNKRISSDKDLRHKILNHLIQKGYVSRYKSQYDNDERIVVTGIHCKLGDNVFTPDRNGREHRNYVSCCVAQCFQLTWEQDYEFLKSQELPMIDNKEYELIYMRDGKGCARHPKVSNKELFVLQAMFLKAQ